MIILPHASCHTRQDAHGITGKRREYREFLRLSTAVLRRWKIAVAVAALGAAATSIASAGTSAVCNAGRDCTQNITTSGGRITNEAPMIIGDVNGDIQPIYRDGFMPGQKNYGQKPQAPSDDDLAAYKQHLKNMRKMRAYQEAYGTE